MNNPVDDFVSCPFCGAYTNVSHKIDCPYHEFRDMEIKLHGFWDKICEAHQKRQAAMQDNRARKGVRL